jgi:hypothetical protein
MEFATMLICPVDQWQADDVGSIQLIDYHISIEPFSSASLPIAGR